MHCNEFIVLTLDMNECALNISGCSQNCTNTIGSYECSCYSGYQLAVDLMSCSGSKLHHFCVVMDLLFSLDINECTLNIIGCSQNCTNTIGSYYCSCYLGYQLQADLLSCSGNKNIIVSVC